ncbi:MAG TPA: hypothetical protein VLW17_08890 [Thermoanaerobaculaceae bacterium]|nr:hypothetical protein [Thermoanaerobaculaceae bacterium]
MASLLAGHLLPFVPTGPDIYVHLLWTQQVMHCLHAGALPVWLPDLNAGFGSPGIRLYSPLGTFLAGALGLVAGDAGSGVRALALFGRLALFALLWRSQRWQGAAEWALLVFAPLAVHDVLGRSAFSEVYALPLMWWLLETSLADRLEPVRDGILAAALWLVHALSAVMTGLLMLGAAALTGTGSALRRLALAALVAGGLTAWYTLPLVAEFSAIPNRAATVEGVFSPERHVLASTSAPNLEVNGWMTWCAVALLAAVLIGRWWRRDRNRTVLIAGCVVVASPMFAWFWRIHSPLQLLQFPWRWLLPAGILAAAPAAASLRRPAGWTAAAVLLVPLAFHPHDPVVRDPGLTAAMDWTQLGARVHRAFEGNPWIVDAAQNRPRSWAWLATNLERFGGERVLVSPANSLQVVRWDVLDREVEVAAAEPARVEFRLLDYPYWEVHVDGRLAAPDSPRGAVGVRVPAGQHRVVVSWAGDPLARVGLGVAAATALAVLGITRRARMRGDGRAA